MISFPLLLFVATATADMTMENTGKNNTEKSMSLRPLYGVKSACTGNSSGLHPDQCVGYQEFFDKVGGTGWSDCNNSRLDPCSCYSQDCHIQCKDGHITDM
jgi:hypothetical protein